MYIRFITDRLDAQSGRRQGLFQAAYGLRGSGQLTPADETRLNDILQWFNENLERPTRLALSPRPHAKAQALSWFRDSAREHVGRIRMIVNVVEPYHIFARMIRTRRPGYVLYEDEFQVAAYPFADTQI